MLESANLGKLSAQEWEYLHEQTDRLEQALSQADTVDLSCFLPPPGTPSRLAFLHELIKTEMEIRCRRCRTIALDEFLLRYSELGAADTLPADLIYEEYRVRHRYGDKPALDLYRQRFPAQFEQLKKLARTDPILTAYSTAEPLTAPTPLPPSLPSRPPPPVSSSQLLPAGAGYELLENIGKGQFGEVYRGLAPGGVPVAIKRVLRSVDDESSQRELKALEKIRELRHPFLLQTHNFYTFNDRLIIVMELADGSLQDRFKECKAAGLPGIPADELLAYFRDAAEALDYLRQEKLAHRDIKPQNLLHVKGYAKVADFGIARRQENAVDHTMNVGGTPAYMPPEMWRGDISVHSDQYSFAATWYEMRTGRRPFSGKTHIDIAQQHLSATPEVSDVPPAEQKVLLRALAKDPQERYPSCKAFVQALAAAAAPPPLPAVGPRSKTTVLLAVALMIVASVLFAMACYQILSPQVTTPPPSPPWLPEGYDRTAEAKIAHDGDKPFYDRIAKKIGAEQVEFVLIPHKDTGERTFYIMKNKVSNGLFKAAVNDMNFQELLAEQQKKFPTLEWDEWRKGGYDQVKARDLDCENDRLPVLRVNVIAADCFAQWLGGKLPQVQQWDMAAGKGTGAKTPYRVSLKSLEPGDIAIDRAAEGPMPVGTARLDFSPFDCSDMAGNGWEWTRNLTDGNLVPPRQADPLLQVTVRGQSYSRPRPFYFGDPTEFVSFTQSNPWVGFRVVIELP